jgi:hypothetical protein
MPPFFKHSNGIHKPRFNSHKPVLHVLPAPHVGTYRVDPAPCFFTYDAFAPITPCLEPVSSVFDRQDCIWFYGTVYVKEATAVAKLNAQTPDLIQDKCNSNTDLIQDKCSNNNNNPDLIQDNSNSNNNNPDLIQDNNDNDNDNDDDTESVTSNNGNANANANGKRNVGKQKQLAHLKDGMLLRHLIPLSSINDDEWFATFDAESNRIIRTPDGVAYDTLRQFARLHHNEVWGTTTVLTNVWSDPHFQYKDKDDDVWHPLSNLKK